MKFKLSPEKYLILTSSIIFCLTLFLVVKSPLIRLIERGKRINILVVGADELRYARHADSIILVSYDPKKRFVDMLSLPRDTLFYLGWRRRKLSEVYAYQYNKTKDEKKSCIFLKEAIEKLLDKEGKIKIPYYVQVNYSCFREIIDSLGGVKINIDQDMDYDDYAQDLHIHLKKGIRRLSGDESLQYIRFRQDVLGDEARIKRQQAFCKLLTKKVASPIFSLSIARISKSLSKNTHTNLNFWNFLVLLNEARLFKMQNLRTQIFPGESKNIGGRSYWVLEKEKKREIVQVIFEKGLLSREVFTSPIISENEPQHIVAEVWNATNRKDLAYNLSRYLRSKGIDVVKWGNFGTYRNHTTIIDRTGNLKIAYRVAKLVGSNLVDTEIDKNRLVDISVVIGEDFSEEKILEEILSEQLEED